MRQTSKGEADWVDLRAEEISVRVTQTEDGEGGLCNHECVQKAQDAERGGPGLESQHSG